MDILGVLVMLLPLALLTWYMVHESGWKIAVLVWAMTGVAIGCLVGGAAMIGGAV